MEQETFEFHLSKLPVFKDDVEIHDSKPKQLNLPAYTYSSMAEIQVPTKTTFVVDPHKPVDSSYMGAIWILGFFTVLLSGIFIKNIIGRR